jgi:hypothetical protein
MAPPLVLTVRGPDVVTLPVKVMVPLPARVTFALRLVPETEVICVAPEPEPVVDIRAAIPTVVFPLTRISPAPVVETAAFIPTDEFVEIMDTAPPLAETAPLRVTVPVWFIVIPPAPVAVIVPVLLFVNVDVLVPVEEKAVAVDTGPLMATFPELLELKDAAFIDPAFVTVTPFAELIVIAPSGVPLPTVPPKVIDPPPAVRARLQLLPVMLARVMPPPPAPVESVEFAPSVMLPKAMSLFVVCTVPLMADDGTVAVRPPVKVIAAATPSSVTVPVFVNVTAFVIVTGRTDEKLIRFTL